MKGSFFNQGKEVLKKILEVDGWGLVPWVLLVVFYRFGLVVVGF